MISAGSLLFTRNTTFGSRMIRFFQGIGSVPALASHQAGFITQANGFEARVKLGVVAFTWDRKKKSILHEHQGEYCVLSPKVPLTDTEMFKFNEYVNQVFTWKYSVLELPLQLADLFLSWITLRRKSFGLSTKAFRFMSKHPVVFRKLGDLWKEGVICSKTANWPLIKVGKLPKILEYASPDETYRYCLESKDWNIEETSENWFKV